MKRQRNERVESIDLANCLMLLSHPIDIKPKKHLSRLAEFECNTCNKKFSSFQALGGHRASHKKPKLDGIELKKKAQNLSLGNNKPIMHECHICGRAFLLGQALGGHMRRHRISFNEGDSSVEKQVLVKVPVLKRLSSKRVMCLDLNLTPLQNDLKLLFGNRAPKIESFIT